MRMIFVFEDDEPEPLTVEKTVDFFKYALVLTLAYVHFIFYIKSFLQ